MTSTGNGSEERTAAGSRTAFTVAAALGAAVVVAVATVVLGWVVAEGGGGRADNAAAPARSAPPLALPASLDGAPRVPAESAPDSVRDIDAVFSRDFDAVTTAVYRADGDATTTLLSTGMRRHVAPAEFVRSFVPKTETATETVLPGWTRPGLMRCWYGTGSVACLWGDDARMLFGSGTDTAAVLVGQMERVYLGDRAGG